MKNAPLQVIRSGAFAIDPARLQTLPRATR